MKGGQQQREAEEIAQRPLVDEILHGTDARSSSVPPMQKDVIGCSVKGDCIQVTCLPSTHQRGVEQQVGGDRDADAQRAGDRPARHVCPLRFHLWRWIWLLSGLFRSYICL